jgi:hypothetical protein
MDRIPVQDPRAIRDERPRIRGQAGGGEGGAEHDSGAEGLWHPPPSQPSHRRREHELQKIRSGNGTEQLAGEIDGVERR